MLIHQTVLPIDYAYPLHEPWRLEDILFFDIETTGFSPKTSYVYLIGCMYYKEGSWQLIQWLNESPSKEPELISEFSSFLAGYKRIIHYNGSGFDIPFLQKKSAAFGLKDPFSHLESFDLYKHIQPLKKPLSLESLKLKAVEEFLSLGRKDTYSGEELIPVYSAFLGRLTYERLALSSGNSNRSAVSSSALKEILLLHNLEDVKNLVPIAGLLLYEEAFQETFLTGSYPPLSCSCTKGINSLDFTFRLPLSFPVKRKVTCPLTEKGALKKAPQYLEGMELSAIFEDNCFSLRIPVYEGTLKYFLTPVSDYYYLPLEDMAVHKSISQYVDKEFRQKATVSNCYLKKSGSFIPQGEPPLGPTFKMNYSDRISYMEQDILNNLPEGDLIGYVKGLLTFFKEFFHI